MESIEMKIVELDNLYSKATSEEDYLRVMKRADELKSQMEREGKNNEEIAEAIYNGLFGNYYWVKKFSHTSGDISALRTKVELWYDEIGGDELKIKYGYLLAVILSELNDDFTEADKIRSEVRGLVEKSGEVVSGLRLINADGLNQMRLGLYREAIKTFSAIDKYGEISSEAFRHAGNIWNNRGAANIRGGIDTIEGARNLLTAADYYLREPEPPRKHLEGLRNRLREALEDLSEKLGVGDINVSLSRGENL